MAEHTELPWRIDPRAETHVIADTRAICSISFFDGDPETRDKNRANAAFIVRAVNSHDALVTALEEIASTGCCGTPGCDLDDPWCDSMTASAALAQVKEPGNG